MIEYPSPTSFTWFSKQNKQQMLGSIPHPPKTLPKAPGYREQCLDSQFLMHRNQITEKENIPPMKLGTICFYSSKDSDEQFGQTA